MALVVKMGTSYGHIDDMLANYGEWSRPEVFLGININGWTVDEKMNAFDAYIRHIATTNCANEFAGVHFAIAMDEPIVNNMANAMFVFGLLSK